MVKPLCPRCVRITERKCKFQFRKDKSASARYLWPQSEHIPPFPCCLRHPDQTADHTLTTPLAPQAIHVQFTCVHNTRTGGHVLFQPPPWTHAWNKQNLMRSVMRLVSTLQVRLSLQLHPGWGGGVVLGGADIVAAASWQGVHSRGIYGGIERICNWYLFPRVD